MAFYKYEAICRMDAVQRAIKRIGMKKFDR